MTLLLSLVTPFALAATLLASACSAPTSAPASAPKRTPVTEASVREGLNDRFLDPELDLQRFLTGVLDSNAASAGR